MDTERGRPRVVSLLPSATEVLCAVGGGGLLVGRSHECDFPREVVQHLPVLTSQLDSPWRLPSSKNS